MKKVLFTLSMAVFAMTNIQAQTISFEETEGYELGDINNHPLWETTAEEDGGFIANQWVSADAASDGVWSLKLSQELDYAPQLQPIVGAYYNYETPVSTDNMSFSADILLTEQGSTSMSLNMGLVDLTEGVYRTYVNFGWHGNIELFVRGGATGLQMIDTGVQYQPGVWNTVRIDTFGEEATFYIDGQEVYSGALPSGGNIDQLRFIHDNYEGNAFIDNVITEPASLSVNDHNLAWNHYYNRNSKTLHLNADGKEFSNLQMFDITGKQMQISVDTTNQIDVSSLPNGVYIVKVQLEATTVSFKFLKR